MKTSNSQFSCIFGRSCLPLENLKSSLPQHDLQNNLKENMHLKNGAKDGEKEVFHHTKF